MQLFFPVLLRGVQGLFLAIYKANGEDQPGASLTVGKVVARLSRLFKLRHQHSMGDVVPTN